MSYEPPPPYHGGYQPPPAGGPPPPDHYHSHGPPPPAYGHGGYGPPPPYSYPPPYSAPPPSSYPPPSGGPPPGVDEVRTIFVTGFPPDVKERELNNLLRFLPGYEASQMNFSKGTGQGFALFHTGAHARAACDQLQNVRFDETSNLRCEMARKNMYVQDGNVVGNKRARTTGPPGGPPGYGGPAPGGYGGGGGGGAGARDDNTPCNTLFVGNLSDHVDENELRSLFSGSSGFRQLKLMRGPKATLGFVEFEDINSAIAAHAAQQGAMLNSSDRGPIRVQYSKNPFGRKRDGEGRPVDSSRDSGYGGGAPYSTAPPSSHAPYTVAPAGSGAPPGGEYSAPPGGH